jgi:hypothetical protein
MIASVSLGCGCCAFFFQGNRAHSIMRLPWFFFAPCHQNGV